MQSTDAPKRTPVIDAKILYSDSSIASRESIEKIKRKKTSRGSVEMHSTTMLTQKLT
jgi:hypothetical protein